MGELQRQNQAIREIHKRLRQRAVPDTGIDLKRKKGRPMVIKTLVSPDEPPALIELPKPNPGIDWWAGRVTPAMILHRVADFYAVGMSNLQGPERARKYTLPRQVYVYLCFKHIPLCTCGIVARVIKKDHTTVLYSRDQILKRLGRGDEKVAAAIGAIEAMIYGQPLSPTTSEPIAESIVPEVTVVEMSSVA